MYPAINYIQVTRIEYYERLFDMILQENTKVAHVRFFISATLESKETIA